MTELHDLNSVLKGRLLVVEDYQRPYAWSSKQLEDLWEDVDLAGSDSHYTGTLVLKQTDAPLEETPAGEELVTYEVVDGQQRLTTCLILLDRIRRRLGLLDDQEGAADAAYQLAGLLRVRVKGVDRPRLRLGKDLDSLWADVIIGDGQLAGTHLIGGAVRLIDARSFFDVRLDALIEGVDEETAMSRLIELRRRVNFRLKFLVYDVVSSAEVGVLFETLNERGKPLTDLEKVKNYLLYLARQIDAGRREDLADRINRAWSEIFKNLADTPLDDDALLSAHWFASRDPNPRSWKRTASIKAAYPRAKYVSGSSRIGATGHPHDLTSAWDQLYEDVTRYVEELRQCSVFLKDWHSSDGAYLGFDDAIKPRVRKASAALIRSNVWSLFRPLVFAMRLKRPQDGEAYAQLIELCERYSARVFAICQYRSNAGRNDLARAAHRLYNGETPDTVLADIEMWTWAWAPDWRVREQFAPEQDWYGRRGHKYVLYEWELHLSRGKGQVRPFEEYVNTGRRKTTEHVLPQTPESDSQWVTDFTPEERHELLNGIGNLVLTHDNSSYRNFEYSRKRGTPSQSSPICYFSPSSLAGERKIADDHVEWTPASVRTRAAELADWALERWAVRQPAEDVVHGSDDEQDEVDALLEAGVES